MEPSLGPGSCHSNLGKMPKAVWHLSCQNLEALILLSCRFEASWFVPNLSKLTYLLVTTRGIPYNVIKIIINMEESQLSPCELASESLGLSLENDKREQRINSLREDSAWQPEERHPPKSKEQI